MIQKINVNLWPRVGSCIFSGASESWSLTPREHLDVYDGFDSRSGIAFISNEKNEDKKVYCRLYLITKDQFIDIFLQENGVCAKRTLIISMKTGGKHFG